ncbi:hypothetical protein VP1G_07217 [Cytospora mali]|uniref:Uncharacterized protein n=1 Tax=Cytospora mali TaxID=578113 RepID=A0A194V7U1_CYTMA|nr:hypothetical protein VP1G_07217 [Valsa mali var. pyri (nom. inval.)]
MDANNGPRPTSSFYSVDGNGGFGDIPLRDLGVNNEAPGPVPVSNIDWTVFREKQKQDHKSWITIMILTAVAVFLGASVAVLGTLYGLEKSKSPQVLTNWETTTSTSIVTSTTSILPVTETTTTSLPPLTETATQTTTLPPLTTTLLQTTTTPMTSFVTETLPPITQTITENQTETEISLVTTIITTTLIFTTIETTTSLISTTKGVQDGQRCTVNYEYGGEDLHNLNGDYDLLMVDALGRAVGKGLDLDTDDYLAVAMRSVFECAVTDVLGFLSDSVSNFLNGNWNTLTT